MVSVKAISKVECIDRNDVREMLLGDRIRTRESEGNVAGRSRLERKESVLVCAENDLRIDSQVLKECLNADLPAQRWNARQGRTILSQLGIDTVHSHPQPE